MKLNKLLAFVLSVLTLGSGCIETTLSDNVKPEAVFQSYQLSYSEQDSSLKVSAEFNVGGSAGTTLELRSPSRVVFDGTELQRESFFGTRYTGQWYRRFESYHSFEWVDQNGKRYVNPISLSPIQASAASPYLSKNSLYVMSFTGPTLSSTESIRIEIKQSIGGVSGTYRVNPMVRGNALRLDLSADPYTRDRLLRGSATLSVIRSNSPALSQATSEGGMLHGEFIAHPISVEITD